MKLIHNYFALLFVMALVSCHTKDNPASEMRVTLNVEEVGCCNVTISATVNSPFSLENSTLNVKIQPEKKFMNTVEFMNLKTSMVYDGKMFVTTGFLSPNQKYIFTASLIQDGVQYDLEPQSFITADLPSEELIDMGVSVKWASCNIGASKPDEGGIRFAWGETAPKESYSLDNYKWYSQDNYTKYCLDDDLRVLQPDDDAATAILGSKWRTPTHDEVIELVDNCNWMWAYYGSTCGLAGTSKTTGKTLFFPATIYNSISYSKWEDYYWTASILYSGVNYLNIDSTTFAESVCMTIQNGFGGSTTPKDDSIFYGLSPVNGGTGRINRYNSALIRPVASSREL